MENCSLELCLSPMTSSLRRDSKVTQSSFVHEYDLVEIQIRAVIEMASKEHDTKTLELAPLRMETPLGFSLKRSVERFLEKRKKRSKCVTPCSYTCSSTSSSSSHNF